MFLSERKRKAHEILLSIRGEHTKYCFLLERKRKAHEILHFFIRQLDFQDK